MARTGVAGLTGYESEALINFFMYHMPMEQRYALMAELPVIYNKVCGAEIVEVRKVSDGTKVSSAPPVAS